MNRYTLKSKTILSREDEIVINTELSQFEIEDIIDEITEDNRNWSLLEFIGELDKALNTKVEIAEVGKMQVDDFDVDDIKSIFDFK